MSYKETDWYSCMTVPVREGVYKTQHRGSAGKPISGYARFYMGAWTYTCPNIFSASNSRARSPQQSREWKGILNGDVPS